MSDLIQVRGLGKSFPQKYADDVTILRDIDFSIGTGETLCVLGESGCGKTTLGKIIAGLTSYTAGSFRFCGQEVSALKGAEWDRFRNSVQMIHQNPYESLNPALMVFDIIANPIRRHKHTHNTAELYQQVTALLELVGLTPVEDFVDKYPSFLSGGQRQRVSIARVLAMDPKLIVVDEATSMIDTSLRISLLGTLRKIQKELHVSYFFITHDLALGKYFALGQKVMIMYLGRSVEEAHTAELMEHPSHPYTKAIISAAVGNADILEKLCFEKYALCGTDIPSFSHVPAGCPLHPRCPEMRQGICDKTPPEFYDLGNEHKVACHICKGREA
ncbi:MAG: ABC transporter ATP-binding protein [Oscillospiraceae bacterium]